MDTTEKKYDLTKVFDPVSGLILQFAVLSATWLLFDLTLMDIILLFILDIFCLGVTLVAEKYLFSGMLGDLQKYYPWFSPKIAREMSPVERKNFIELLLSFPRRRVIQTSVGSILKVIPSFFVVVFFMDKSGGGVLEGCFKFWIMEILYIFLIFGSLVYTTTSRAIFEIVDDLNSRFDLSEALSLVSTSKPKNDMFVAENTALLASATALVILASLAIQMEIATKAEFLINFIVIMTGGLMSIGRVYFLNRRNFLHGLHAIFERLTAIERGETKAIPLHCDTTLANFEQTFNTLVSRLQLRDQEIESWMSLQVEQNKMANLGESISLVTHDMVSPLHAIGFCIDEVLDEDLDKNETLDFLEQARFNLKRVNEMVDSVKYSLKNPRGKEVESSLFDAYGYTIQLLKTHFDPNEIENVEFVFDPALVSVKCNVSHTNLMHVLYNTMKNSVSNLIKNDIEDPVVEVIKVSNSSDEIEIAIKDNGTGLSPLDFDQMTSQNSLMDTRRGLGIRLTKRMIEKYRGDMFVAENDRGFGTDMHVTLPRSL